MTWLRMLALAVAALSAWSSVAHADDEIPTVSTEMSFAEKDGALVVTATFAEVFDKRAYDGLASGFATTVALRAFIYPAKGDDPVGFSAATFRVIYDLWDEVYEVQIVNPRGRRTLPFKSRADALRAITEVDHLPLARLDSVPIGPRFRCVMIVERNPVSARVLAEMRRWLTRRGGTASLDGNAALFGSVVSVFVNPKLQRADASLRLRSQRFYRVER